MTIRNLQFLLQPRSVVVIGASDRPHSVGGTVYRNMLKGGFKGPIWPVNTRHKEVAGTPCFKLVSDLPQTPDLAIVCTPAPTIPDLISELATLGTRAAIVLTAGLDEARTPDGRSVMSAMLDAARPALLRILGPNCVGLLVPGIGLNASFAHAQALSGQIAFVSQSGALTTAMLDWARDRDIGFTHFISLGNSADVDFGDLLNYLATDAQTRAILLYIESISAARKFMSAARRAARNKPVIVVKSGRVPEAAKAAASHTGALVGSDAIYDTAFQRAGLLRVDSTRELFDAAETLARLRPPVGDRLLIVSNGGGPAVMALDALIRLGGQLAELDTATLTRLDAVLSKTWSHANPVDLIGDAPVERYISALDALLTAPTADALLLIHAPTAIVSPTNIARACAPILGRSPIPTLVCWMGGPAVRKAKSVFDHARLAAYETPEEAVGAFMQLVRYRRNQELLMQTPLSMAESLRPDIDGALRVINSALDAGRTLLSEAESKAVLVAYEIPVVETRIVLSPDPAAPALEAAANQLGFPLAVKIVSPQISHKSDVGGVALDIETLVQLRDAARAMVDRCRQQRPDAELAGFSVQRMVQRGDGVELIAGIASDPTFGPVVMFGRGGTAVELIDDKALALPPLNLLLARELIARTRVSRVLHGYRNHQPVNLDAVALTLVKLAQLATDLAQVAEVDINPLLADASGVIALDARIRVQRAVAAGVSRLAIRPYPRELEERTVCRGRSILLRPIRPEDEPQHREFLARVSPEDLRARFFHAVNVLPHSQLASFTQIDYDREMAFIAVDDLGPGDPRTLGVSRSSADPDGEQAEFAVLVQSDQQGLGLGATLLNKMIRYCRSRGIRRLVGETLADNRRMLALAQACDFDVIPTEAGSVRLILDLQSGH